MAIICAILAVACAIGAVMNRSDKAIFFFLAACALLNAAAAIDMIATQYEYSWSLAPNDGVPDPGYHYRR